MEFNKFQAVSYRTVPDEPKEKNIVNFALGLAGECGEVVDYIKKVEFHGHALDKSKLCEELGDVLWYLSNLSREYDIDLDTIAKMNMVKLDKRYPSGFSKEDSIKRVDVL